MNHASMMEPVAQPATERQNAGEAGAHSLPDEASRQFQAMLDDFGAAPSRTALFEIATIAEIAVLGRDLPTGARLVALAAESGRRWVATGVLEDVCFSEAQMVSPVALLLLLCGESSEVLQRLSNSGMVGRSEWPTLTQLCISATLNQCGIAVPLPEVDAADLDLRIDKRCLRSASTEYDLSLLITTAQLLRDPVMSRMRPGLMAIAPRLLPRLLLVQSLRDDNWNWAAVLAFLCRRAFGLPSHLSQAFDLKRAATRISPDTFDLPPAIRGQTEYFSRSARALRLRSIAAFAMYQECDANLSSS